jgi:hypothetical protein
VRRVYEDHSAEIHEDVQQTFAWTIEARTLRDQP